MNLNTIRTAVQHRRDTLASALAQLDGIDADAATLEAGDLRPYFAWHLARLDRELTELSERLAHQRDSHEIESERIRQEAVERVEVARSQRMNRRDLSAEQIEAADTEATAEAERWADAEIAADAARPKCLDELEKRHAAKVARRAELAAAAESAAVLSGADATRAAVGYVACRLVEVLGDFDVRPGVPERALASSVGDGHAQARLTAAAVKTA